MVRIADTLSGQWLKVEDLGSNPAADFLDLTIEQAQMGTFADGKVSLDLTFHEHEKKFGCQPTNRKRLIMLFGEEVQVESLPGQRIRLHAEMTTTISGSPCWGVRIVAVPNTLQADSAAAKERIAAAMVDQGVRPRTAQPAPPQGNPVMDQEPGHFADEYDQSKAGF